MTRRRLTDRALQALKKAPTGRRYDVPDLEARGLNVRVNDRGDKTFVLIARFGGGHPTRRMIGHYPSMSLAEARDEARQWRTMIKEGKIPASNENARVKPSYVAKRAPSPRWPTITSLT